MTSLPPLPERRSRVPVMSRELTAEDAYAAAAAQTRRGWIWLQGPGRKIATVVFGSAAYYLRRNLAPRRLFSLPHFLVVVWMVILLWGERWVFDSKVETCSWDHWEKWVRKHWQTCASLRPILLIALHMNSPKERTRTDSCSSPTLK